MGRSAQDSASDTSVDEVKKTVASKVRKRKKKRKRNVTDLTKRLSKAKKHKRRQGNFVKLVEDFEDLRKEYEKEARIDGKSSKPRSKKLATRILPKPLVGIYKNGAIGKEIRKSQMNPATGDTDNARLEGDVRKLLNGYDSKSGVVMGNTNESTKQSTSKVIFVPYSSDGSTSSPLVRMDGGAKHRKPEKSKAPELPQASPDKIGTKEYQETALRRYEDLCQTVSSENFEGKDFPDHFPAADPLMKVKKKLRSFYAESFRFQFMRDAFRRDLPVSSAASSDETSYPPGDNQNPFLFTADDVKNQKNKEDARESSTSNNLQDNGNNFLFDSSEISGDSRNLIASQTRKEMNEPGKKSASLEVNCATSSLLRSNKSSRLFEMGAKDRDKSDLFEPEQSKPVYKKHIRKEGNPRVHVINSKLKRYSGVQNMKVQQQMKLKNLKHVPPILRKCKNTDSCRQNLFEKSPHVDKEMLFKATSSSVLFTPPSCVTSEAAAAPSFDSENVETCVVASPSVHRNTCFVKSRKPKVPQEIFINKKNPVQKTVMFTKKDSINVGQCLYMNSVIKNDKRENPNVCVIRKNVPLRENVCKVHRNCQRIPGTCYREFKCSQNSELSQPNCSSQEFNESQNEQMNQQMPEEVLLRRMHKCDRKCNDVCYVVVDQCKHGNAHECPNNNRTRQLQGQLYQEDVAILDGVQNLKLIKDREARSQENAVLLEQQPIKYLAFENDSKPRKIPIYMQNKRDVGMIDPSVNYRLVSCPNESAKEVILVPTCESKKVLYVKQNAPSVSHEECSHPTKVVVVKDSSNVCGIHVPKQNIMEIRNPEYNVVTNLADNSKRRINWEELHYRPNHEHDVCLQNQTIFYQK